MSFSTGTFIQNLPTGTIDALNAIVPMNINMTGTPQTIQSSLQQIGDFYGYAFLSAQRIYSSSGTHTWSKPSNLAFIVVECVGGGGGGGGAEGNTSNAAGAAGGGSGGYSRKRILVGALGSTETVTVGGGGQGGLSTPAGGTTGGQSSFGSHCSASGGVGGGAQNAGTTVAIANGGAGGSAANGDVNVQGSSGHYGLRLDGTNSIGGHGGASLLGGGTRAGLGVNADGTAGIPYGGGGGGARTSNNTTDRPGGDGAVGIVIVYEYTLRRTT